MWGVSKVKGRAEAHTAGASVSIRPSGGSQVSDSKEKRSGRAPQIPSDPQARARADQAIREELWSERPRDSTTIPAHSPQSASLSDPKETNDARQQRIEQANRRELVRTALRSTGAHGYYVFDELVTEHAGTLDYLAVGPLEVAAIIVREDRGVVSADRSTEALFIDGRSFEDDPRKQAEDLQQDIVNRVFDGKNYAEYFICFTNARLQVDQDNQYPRSTTPLMDLPWALDPEGEQSLTPADIEDIAEKVEAVYGRPPFVRPQVGEDV